MKQLTLKEIEAAEDLLNTNTPKKQQELFEKFQKKHVAYINLLGHMYIPEKNPLNHGEFMADFYSVFSIYEIHYKLTIRKFTSEEFSSSIGK